MNNKLDELDLAVSYVNSLGTVEIDKIARTIAVDVKTMYQDQSCKIGKW
jgi:hypothetical protein